MFSFDVNDSWESTAFQDNFIKGYFGKQTILKGTAKVNKMTNISMSESVDLCSNNNDDVKSKKRSSSKRKKRKISLESFPQENHASDSPKSKKLEKKSLKDSLSLVTYSEPEDLCSNNNDDVKSKKRSSSKRKKKKISLESSPQRNLASNSPKSKKLEKKSLKDSLVTYSSIIKSGKKMMKFKSKNKNLMNLTEPSPPNNILEIKDCETKIARSDSSSKKNKVLNKAYEKLQAAKFRYLNELLYTNTGKHALSYFQDNSEEFEDYHVGYQTQVSKWPINPVDVIIKELCKMSKQSVIADLGCGEAKIAEVLPDRTVHSFDLIALKDCVTACDMAKLPLPDDSVDVTVFCLSLMGTNWRDYLVEGRRILKLGGYLKIAEIESRIENVDDLIKNIEYYGFSLTSKNVSHKMFVFLNFKKMKNNVKSTKVKAVTLKPCLYKKR